MMPRSRSVAAAVAVAAPDVVEEARRQSRWNMLVGGTFDIGAHWGLRAEFGFIHRKSVFLMGNYRIPR